MRIRGKLCQRLKKFRFRATPDRADQSEQSARTAAAKSAAGKEARTRKQRTAVPRPKPLQRYFQFGYLGGGGVQSVSLKQLLSFKFRKKSCHSNRSHTGYQENQYSVSTNPILTE